MFGCCLVQFNTVSKQFQDVIGEYQHLMEEYRTKSEEKVKRQLILGLCTCLSVCLQLNLEIETTTGTIQGGLFRCGPNSLVECV